MNTIFTFELLLVTVIVVGAVAAALYLVVTNRRKRRESGRKVGSADAAVGLGPGGFDTDATERRAPREPRREFYKRMSLENDEDMKMRLYSLDEYRGELGGDMEDSGTGRFVGAIKAYRPLGDEWYDFPPDKAADVLELSPEEYEVDRERGVLLLRKLPRGLPLEARDIL
ncbi:MAG: hypothetical protein M3122_05635 [Actinomycetota bacterium]|nr:hypothetical protein [Actinomycetota bacterium]